MMRLVPSQRSAVNRLGLVHLDAMVAALVHAVENPPAGVRVIEVPEIRSIAAIKSVQQPDGAPSPA
jgi:nucleoside-diphosphate-sugar epimerase